MQEWTTLAQRMILGSDANPSAFTSDQPALQAFFCALQSHTPPQQLLQALAGLQWLRKLGAPFQHDAIEATPLPEDDAAGSAAICALIQTALQARQMALLREVFQRLAQQRRILPPELLVDCFEWATTQPELQRLLPAVCGKRGLQLAQWNPTWQFITDADLSALQGEALVRQLMQARSQDHAAFLAMLTPLWPSLGARDRQKIVAALVETPHPNEQSFLHQCLADRSLPVRQLATHGLAKGCDDAVITQIQDTLATFIQFQPPRLLRKGVLSVSLPETYDPDWERYGIQETLEYHELSGKLGRKSSWLYQWLSLLPPTALLAGLQCSAEDYLKYADKTDHANLLLPAWASAALLHDDIDALAILWGLLSAKQQQHWQTALLTQARQRCREWLLTQLLAQADTTPDALGTVLLYLPQQSSLSRPFALQLRRQLLKQVDALTYWHQSHQQRLDDLAFALDAAHIDDWIAALQTNTPARLENCLRWLLCRQQLHQELPS